SANRYRPSWLKSMSVGPDEVGKLLSSVTLADCLSIEKTEMVLAPVFEVRTKRPSLLASAQQVPVWCVGTMELTRVRLPSPPTIQEDTAPASVASKKLSATKSWLRLAKAKPNGNITSLGITFGPVAYPSPPTV